MYKIVLCFVKPYSYTRQRVVGKDALYKLWKLDLCTNSGFTTCLLCDIRVYHLALISVRFPPCKNGDNIYLKLNNKCNVSRKKNV